MTAEDVSKPAKTDKNIITGDIVHCLLILTAQAYHVSWNCANQSRHHLRSAARQQLVVLRHRLSFHDRRAFCVAGPSVWNSLLDSLRDPVICGNSFRQSLKTFLSTTY